MRTLCLIPLLGACAGQGPAGDLAPDLEHRLTQREGCGDAVFVARTTLGDLAIRFAVEGVARRAHDVGTAVLTSYDLSREPLLTLASGDEVWGSCDDARERPGSFEATSGEVDLTVAPRGDRTVDASPARADLIVHYAELVGPDGAWVELVDFRMSSEVGEAP